MYDRDKIESQAVDIIAKEELTSFYELSLYLAPAMSTLYVWELDKSEIIKEALERNRSGLKKKLKNKWAESDNAVLQISAFKLAANQEELDRLTVNKQQGTFDLNIHWTETKTYDSHDKADKGA